MLRVVNLCITNRNKDKFLFIKRSKPPFRNHWGMLGGKVEKDEHHGVAASRELGEESGILSNGSYLGTCFEKIVERNQVKSYFEIYFYHFDVDENVSFKSGEEGELKWFSLEELKGEKVIPSDLLMIEAFLKNGKREVVSVIHQSKEDYFQKKFYEKEGLRHKGCVFCNPDRLHVLRESENTRTFLSKNYLLKGHCLVIPKDHYESILDMPKDVLMELMEEVCEVKKLLINKMNVGGVDIKQHYRPFLEESKYKVDHVHFHVLPREFEDELYKKSMVYERDVVKELSDEEVEEMKRVLGSGVEDIEIKKNEEEIILDDIVYGNCLVKEPVLIELINSKPIQRLKGIAQFGVPDEYYHKNGCSRYDHSIGVFILLQKLGANLEEQIAGLLHDVSHTAFSHVIDCVLGDPTKEDYQDNNHLKIIENSEIKYILIRYGFDYKKIADLESFTLLDKDIPSLCVDRLDYSLREMVMDGGDVADIFSDLLNYHGQIVFQDAVLAEKFSRSFIGLQNMHWAGNQARGRYYLLAGILKDALDREILSLDDFYLEDKDVINLLLNSGDSELIERLNRLKKNLEIINSNEGILLKKKFRYVDPEILDNGMIKKLSEISKNYAEFLDKEKLDSKIERRIKISIKDE